MRCKTFFLSILLFISFSSVFSFEKEQLNGGWLVESNYERLKNNDEYFTNTLSVIKIGSNEYYYSSVGLLIDLEKDMPEIRFNYWNRFEVKSIQKLSEDCFLIEVQNKKDRKLKGALSVKFIDSTGIIFYFNNGDEEFMNEINSYAIGEKFVYRLIGKMK